MDDIQKALSESKRLIATGRQLLKETIKLLRQSQNIIQQSRAALRISKSIASDRTNNPLTLLPKLRRTRVRRNDK